MIAALQAPRHRLSLEHAQPAADGRGLPAERGMGRGRAEFYRREGQGVAGRRSASSASRRSPTDSPAARGRRRPIPALRDMGIRMYLDEADHVGHRRSAVLLRRHAERVQDAIEARAHGAAAAAPASTKARRVHEAAYERLRAKGGGTISIYYHPSEWVHTEFWDGVNFSRGANPAARASGRQPGTRPAAETEQAFADFEQYMRFIKAQPGVRFVTATELMRLYADRR